MRINYNFAFKDSKLRQWQRPSPPNLLVTDASLKNKLIYILKTFNHNSELFYPSTLIFFIILCVQIINFYPNKELKNLEDAHNQYVNTSKKLANLNSSKNKFKIRINNLDSYFSEATTSYLFTFYLQNSVPKGVKIIDYAYSDNGFEINATAFSIDSLNEFITLIIESPIIQKNSVSISKLNRKENSKSSKLKGDSKFDLQIYGDINKLDIKRREELYKESGANGLLKKLQRFNFTKTLLKS